MGAGIFKPKPATFLVKNESDTQLKVNVCQVTERKAGTTSSEQVVGIDAGKAASAAMDIQPSDDPLENAKGAAGVLGSLSLSAKSKQNVEYLRDDKTFAIIGPKQSLAFNLPSGKKAEIFVTITSDDKDKTAVCGNYSPPAGCLTLLVNNKLQIEQKRVGLK